MNPSGFQYLAHDKEKLLKTLARFDGGITVDDVTDGAHEANEYCNSKYYHTVLLQILLEAICKSYIKNEQQREILLQELCMRLSKFKVVTPSLLMDIHNPLRIELKQQFFEFVKEVLNEVIPEAEIDERAVSFLESNKLSSNPNYCYYKCFEELHEIGRGGFGVVFKAKDKLTHQTYAVKKISFKYKNDAGFLKVIREAKNIAALDHPNVVRYNNAWLEVVSADSDVNQSMRNNASFDTCDTSEGGDESFFEKGVSAIVITPESSTTNSSSTRTIESVIRQNSDFNSNGSSQSVIFSNSAEYPNDIGWTLGSCDENKSEQIIDKESSSDLNDETTEVHDMPFRLNLNVRAMLYIQMEYCDCDLRFWLDERVKGNELPFDMDVTEIFCNILRGLSHIHSKSIIHRDLKPQNIFYSKASNILKIGDFGLATLPDSSVDYLNDYASDHHSDNLGTLPYAAPEQLKSTSYDSKVDIYSLGIILIELMNTFSSSMEFSKAITDVKKGKIYEAMNKFPHFVSIVRNLVSKNPNDRMPAEEILAYCEEDTKAKLKETEKALEENKLELKKVSDLLNNKEEIILQKEKIISQKEEIICQKEEIIRQMEVIIRQNFEEIEKLRATSDKSCTD